MEENNHYRNFLATLNADDILPNVLEVINTLKVKQIKIAIAHQVKCQIYS